jgi:hypothetical protein
MTERQYSLAGWLALAAAVLTIPMLAAGIATDVIARKAPELAPLVLLAYISLAVLQTFCGLYALWRFRTLLNERYDFHRVDALVTVIVVGVIVLMLLAITSRVAFLAMGGEARFALIAIAAIASVSIPLAIVSIIFGARLLTLGSDLGGYLKPLAILTIAAGVCFATFVLAPVGLVIDAAGNVVLGLIFLRTEARPAVPEFV